MTPEKKAARKQRNREAKLAKTIARQSNLALVGKLVYDRVVGMDLETEGGPTEIKVLDFPPAIRTSRDGSILPLKNRSNDIPSRIAGYGSTSLLHVSAKQHRQHGPSMKTRPGNPQLHAEAVVEDASRSLAKQIDAALAPADTTPIPVIPMNLAEEASQL
jgi:hypothetical protein